jgi:hypothetical protein
MSSNSQRPVSAAAISSVSGRTLSASLRTGTTTETAGVPLRFESAIGVRYAAGAAFLLANQPAGNRLEAAP